MFYEWVLIFLLIITVLLGYIMVLLRKLLSHLESLPTMTAQVPQPIAAGAVQPVTSPSDSGQAALDDEIAAVITAAIAAYEEDENMRRGAK